MPKTLNMKVPMLTNTEERVVRLRLQGMTHGQIAQRTGRSLQTIRKHQYNVYHKLKIRNEPELYNWYVENILGINIREILESLED